jgi:hypothetical protein
LHNFIYAPTETRQNEDPQNPCKEADDGRIPLYMTEMQNSYKLPLNSELTMFTEKPDESTNNVIIGYQYRFEHKV